MTAIGSLVRTYHGGLGFVSSVYDQYIKLDNKGVLYNKRTVALINKSIGLYSNEYKLELLKLYNGEQITIGYVVDNIETIKTVQNNLYMNSSELYTIKQDDEFLNIPLESIYYLKTKSLECIL